jgi:UDP-GlcNAc:undecaprenyl-phosphate GlcNAc-1-phosphate transferase
VALNPGVAVAAGAVVTAAATPVAIAVARRTGIMDHPGPLKPQGRSVPYLGGLAVFVGVAAGVLTHPGVARLGPLTLAGAVGLVDDWRGLPPLARLGLEAVVGVAVAVATPVGHLGPVGFIATVLATVSLMNAVNLVDGLDGLASGVCLAACLVFAALTHGSAQVLALGTAGALAAFLLYNRPPARVYLGDCGSYLLGATLATLLAACWRSGRPGSVSAASLLLVAYPALEVASSVTRRWRGHQPLFIGDRDHSYDRLVRSGWPVGRVAITFAGAELVLGGAAAAVKGTATLASCAVVAMLCAATVAAAGAGGLFSAVAT